MWCSLFALWIPHLCQNWAMCIQMGVHWGLWQPKPKFSMYFQCVSWFSNAFSVPWELAVVSDCVNTSKGRFFLMTSSGRCIALLDVSHMTLSFFQDGFVLVPVEFPLPFLVCPQWLLHFYRWVALPWFCSVLYPFLIRLYILPKIQNWQEVQGVIQR